MNEERLEFNARKVKIVIDYSRCEPAKKANSNPSCGFACVKACRLYGRNILKIDNNKPILAVTNTAEIERLDNECISCEYSCWLHGSNCISTEIPLPGIEQCRANLGGGKHDNNNQ